MNKKFYILQPLFIAIYPSLFMFSVNVGETYTQDCVIITFLAALLGLTVFWISNLFFNNLSKSSLFTSAFLLMFFNLGHVAFPLTDYTVADIRIFRWRNMVIFLTFLFLYLFIKIYKSKKQDSILAKCFILPFLALNLISVFNIAKGLGERGKLLEKYRQVDEIFEKEHLNVTKAENIEDLPNIYYIILDRYPSKETLLKLFNYDNSEFLRKLEGKGFFLPKSAYSNYSCTRFSVPSSLNFSYYDTSKFHIPPELSDALANYMVKNNRAARFLKLKGYNYRNLGSSWVPSQPKIDTSKEGAFGCLKGYFYGFLHRCYGLDYYIYSYIRQTYLGPFYDRLIYMPWLRRTVKNQLQQLRDSVNWESPNFIYAHFECPHPPVLFDALGNPKDSGFGVEDHIGNITFISNEIYAAIEHILEKSKKPPVIILQSDHGVEGEGYYEELKDPKDPERLRSMLKAHFGILYACYFPVEAKKLLYDNMSPVNNFRLIFDHYMGSDFNLLEDSSYVGILDNGTFVKIDHWLSGQGETV